jgi:hypothetical protein
MPRWSTRASAQRRGKNNLRTGANMNRVHGTLLAALLTTCLAGPIASAQSDPTSFQGSGFETSAGQQAQTPQPAVANRGQEYVEEKGFKGRIFDIKHRDPGSLIRAVQPLGSGFRGATMSFNQETRTLSVRDFPENIATIEEALKRLDVPEAPRPDIEFSINVLIGSNGPSSSSEYPQELSDVVQQLKLALKYHSYGLMTAAIHRTKEGRDGVGNTGVAESKLFSVPQPEGSPTFYSYNLNDITLDNSPGAMSITIGRLSFNMRIPLNVGSTIQYENVGFKSPVSLRQGEKVVVGSTTMGDKALIVVISAKVLK